MSTTRDKKWLLAAFLVPVIVLVAMTVMPVATILFGDEIRIETEPVDPRDLFRGDYVTLQYAIDRIELDRFPWEFRSKVADQNYSWWEDRKFRREPLYVVLEDTGFYHEVSHVSFSKPRDGVYLKARLQYIYRPDDNRLHIAVVNYGLGRFHVPENTGRILEDAARKGQLAATVKVRNGYAILRSVEPKP